MPYLDVDGGRIYYDVAGHGPMLLIYPGNTSGAVHHAGELAYFSDRFLVVTFDYLGYGRSTRLEALPDDFYWRNASHGAALCRRLGQERMIVLGTSGGGIAALMTAVSYPERVIAVVADSTPADYPVEKVEWLVSERQAQTPAMVAFWQAAHGNDWPAVVQADSEMIRRVAGNCGGDLYGRRLQQITCPVLVTASYEDIWIGEPGIPLIRLVGQMPTAKGVLFPSGGHPLIWSQPGVFRREADRFLRDVIQSM